MGPTKWSRLMDRCFPPTCQKEDALRKLRPRPAQCPQWRFGAEHVGRFGGHYNRRDSGHTNSVKRYKVLAMISLFTWLAGDSNENISIK